MRNIYKMNLEKFSKYTEEQMRRQDEKDEWGEDEFFDYHPPVCPDCGEDKDECDCDVPSGEKW